jgi:hypothetical protein
MFFCNKHRLPENHNCPFDLRRKRKNLKTFDKILYEDALEYMSKELTVAKIYDYVTTKSMTKSEAIELLTYFIENNENSEIRKISIQAFEVLELKSKKVYNILENCLLSDEDPQVKKVAEKLITNKYPKRSRDLLNWIKEHNKIMKKKR